MSDGGSCVAVLIVLCIIMVIIAFLYLFIPFLFINPILALGAIAFAILLIFLAS